MDVGDTYDLGWGYTATSRYPEYYCQELQSFGLWYRQTSDQDWILLPVGERVCVLMCSGWMSYETPPPVPPRKATVVGIFDCIGSARNYVARTLLVLHKRKHLRG